MKELTDLDNLYNSLRDLPTDVRLWYCTRHLDKLQLLLANNAGKLDSGQKEKIKEMIRATQDEIHKLEKQISGGQRLG